MTKIFFLCQASGDIIHILQEAHKIHITNNNVSIKVLCLYKELIESWKFLSISFIEIEYFPRYFIPISQPWKLFSWRKKVNSLFKKEGFNNTQENSRIYFTSIYDDPTTAYYVHKLYKLKYQIYYLNHYDDKQAIIPVNHISIKDKIRLLLYRFLTNINFDLYYMSGRWNVLRFPKEKYHFPEISSEINHSICQQYAYTIKNEKGKYILLFSQPNRDFSLVSDQEYNYIYQQVSDRLKEKGYFIVQKGHPVIGLCESIKSQADIIIPATIPSELINLSSFDACYGFMTIALASTAKLGSPSYSFLPLVKNHTTEAYKGAIDFVNSSSENKIKYINKIEDIQ